MNRLADSPIRFPVQSQQNGNANAVDNRRTAVYLLLALGCLFLAYISRLQPITHDAFHEMSVVRQWLTTGDFPQDDVFAYTPTVSPSVHHEWATGWVLYWAGATSPLGIHGITLLKYLLVLALWIMLLRSASWPEESAGNASDSTVVSTWSKSALLFAPLSLVTFPFLWVGFATVRAQLFTLCFLAAQVLMQRTDASGKKRWVWLWIPMMLAWLNIHAGFVVGIGMLGFYGIERMMACSRSTSEKITSSGTIASRQANSKWLYSFSELLAERVFRIWHLFCLLPILCMLVMLNPWTVDYVPYLVRAISMDRPTMLEWQPLWHTHNATTTMVAWAASVGLLLYVAVTAWRQRWSMSRLHGLAFCALAAIMALKHIRHGSLFAVVWMAYVPRWIGWTPIGQKVHQWFVDFDATVITGAKLAIITSLLFACWQPFWKTTVPNSLSATSHPYPVGVVEYLAENEFSGNALVPFHTGSYVTWKLYPSVRVSIDGRYEVAYAEHVLPMHNRLYRAEAGWEQVLAEFQSDVWLIQRDSKIFDVWSEYRQKDLSCLVSTNTFTLEVSNNESELRYAAGDRINTFYETGVRNDNVIRQPIPPAARAFESWQVVYEDDSFVLLGRKELHLPRVDRRGHIFVHHEL